MDIYVVLDGPVLVGASARLQGAELLRSEWAVKLASQMVPVVPRGPVWEARRRVIYDRQQIVNTELQDAE